MKHRTAIYGLAVGALALTTLTIAAAPSAAQEKAPAAAPEAAAAAEQDPKTTARDYGVTEGERRSGGPLLLGAFVFSQRCSVCHDKTADGPAIFGPHLEGIVGRKAAATGWSQHSDALSDSDLVWTEQAIDKLLSEPQEAMPGVKMDTVIRFRRSRRALISYMKTL